MEQVKWFDRHFLFHPEQNIFPSILERLWGTPIRLRVRMEQLMERMETSQEHSLLTVAGPEASWSILENIGHLIDLEELWQGRLTDILGGEKYLREWDLENGKTYQANHNSQQPDTLLRGFASVRAQTINTLQLLKEEDIIQSSLHPRLHQPMRIADLFLFVAEHDDHHLARISWLIEYHTNTL
ncbi:MAG: DinB family protein [Bacteroidota bacterium]